jgi:hypothetical protein
MIVKRRFIVVFAIAIVIASITMFLFTLLKKGENNRETPYSAKEKYLNILCNAHFNIEFPESSAVSQLSSLNNVLFSISEQDINRFVTNRPNTSVDGVNTRLMLMSLAIFETGNTRDYAVSNFESISCWRVKLVFAIRLFRTGNRNIEVCNFLLICIADKNNEKYEYIESILGPNFDKFMNDLQVQSQNL